MKIGIFSDIHGNFEALERVLEFLESRVDKFICCGDIVGYGPKPNECIEKILSLGDKIACVCGNHDWAALGLEDITKFNEDARIAIKWTREVLSQDSVNFLMGLDYKLGGANFIVVHGSLRDPLDEYILNTSDYIPSMKKQAKKILFVGHTHQPLIFRGISGVVDIIPPIPEKPIFLEDGSKYLVNVGSVGQPRDGNPKSSCVIYEEETSQITYYRIDYDIAKVQQQMREVRLPEFLIQRLERGV